MEGSPIDWEALAESLHAVSGDVQTGSDSLGRQTLAALIEDRGLEQAVEHYVQGGRGAELVRSVLRLLRPAVACDRCLSVYSTEPDIRLRRAAAELLRYIGDRRSLALVRRFFEDTDETIQSWGASLLEQLITGESITATEAEEYLRLGEAHINPRVRQIVSWINDSLRDG